MSLRIVLFGTGDFALPTFSSLIESPEHEVVAVYTQPDRTGRGHHRHVNKVKVMAEANGVPVYQPEKVNTPEAVAQLRSLNADVFVVAAYGQILKPEFLAVPPMGAFNLHGSLLPRHRGAAPVQYSIWKGDLEAGVTMFQIEPALDSGPMIGKVATKIRPTETSGELMLRLADLSVELTVRCLSELEQKTATFEPQDVNLVTLSPKIRKEDGLINWTQSATEIDCHIRAMQPWPKASSMLRIGDRPPFRCIIVKASPVPAGSGQPGSVEWNGQELLVGCADGQLQVETIQPAGKKAMDAGSFANGYGLGNDARFELPDSKP